MNEYLQSVLEIWGGIECSYNRVGDTYMDQLDLSGHYLREDDIDRFASLGIKALRYPVLWERHSSQNAEAINWTIADHNLNKLKNAGIVPILGLVHHGSGPEHASFYDDSFAEGLAAFATLVAERFPWITDYTPVNEPLTTARFCGLYGHWFPHGHSDIEFLRILLSECKAVVVSMEAIRKVNPNARLIQTEDLGKTHSTPKLNYQAEFENLRRWLSLDLLCGNVIPEHPLFNYLLEAGLPEKDIRFFSENPCIPDMIGINHYVTSERYLDEDTASYPNHTRGGNGRDTYADVEAVRVSTVCIDGPYRLLKEAWERFSIPMAVTEVHLHCTREEQLRWFNYVVMAAVQLKKEGVDIRAVTAWAIMGSFDWCSLLTRQEGIYESGVFDIRGQVPRATALTKMVQTFAQGKMYVHPVLDEDGWWQRNCRINYGTTEKDRLPYVPRAKRPILITGKTGTLGKAFARICTARGIYHHLLDRTELNITDPVEIEATIKRHHPWAIINAAGFVKVDEAESEPEQCFLVNSVAPGQLALQCRKQDIKFMTFSSDLVFDGKKNDPYLESDAVAPLNVYGQSKARAEKEVLANDPNALIIRTSAFFGPWDQHNFVYQAMYSFMHNLPFRVANDVIISPTYVPDLVHTSLDLMMDDEAGIWNITNKGDLSWAMLAKEVAQKGRCSSRSLYSMPLEEMGLVAPRPHYSVLKSEKCFQLPSLDNSLERFFHEQELFKF